MFICGSNFTNDFIRTNDGYVEWYREAIRDSGWIGYRKQHASFLNNANMRFHTNGVVDQGDLRSNHSLRVGTNDIVFNGNTLVAFYESGELSFGILSSYMATLGGHRFTFVGATLFYQNGIVRNSALSGGYTVTVGGHAFSIKGGLFGNIAFYENESLKQASLSGDHTVNGVTHRNNHYIRFNQDGTVHSSGSSYDYAF